MKSLNPLFVSALVAWLGLVTSARAAEALPSPLPQAHAHNDYEHPRPLLDALDQGFCSVEADIYLVDGALLVAHDRGKVKPERTLQALYLEPLRARTRQNGGRIHAGGPDLMLLIDLKSEAASTYAVLRKVLQDYAEILTEFSEGGVRTNAVTVVLSGNRPIGLVQSEPVRLAGIDGRPPDLETKPSNRLVPLVSDSWSSHFKWRGEGPMPPEEREKLVAMVAKAHAQGRRIRFWGGADRASIWQAQREAGVDLINTDKLAELRAFLLNPVKP